MQKVKYIYTLRTDVTKLLPINWQFLKYIPAKGDAVGSGVVVIAER